MYSLRSANLASDVLNTYKSVDHMVLLDVFILQILVFGATSNAHLIPEHRFQDISYILISDNYISYS